MKSYGNTILITGGSSGIGKELARQFMQMGNRVVICGRSEVRLVETQKEIPGIAVFACDIAVESERERK